jgi:hypothetical protein
MLFEVVKGNSMRDVDKFTGVLNRLVGSEEISMISVGLSYMYDFHTCINILWKIILIPKIFTS